MRSRSCTTFASSQHPLKWNSHEPGRRSSSAVRGRTGVGRSLRLGSERRTMAAGMRWSTVGGVAKVATFGAPCLEGIFRPCSTVSCHWPSD
eukprot:scaffold5138_cov251-Pinguiococcus_pyrenoidosus.AAC.17